MNTKTDAPAPQTRRFVTYRGVSLPLTLVEELTPESLRNRNTYFQATYDSQGRMVRVEKLVYGEVELCHDYRWREDGTLDEATISTPDEDVRVLRFDLQGRPT